ncbi:MAG: fibro-slime domain-containing protein [Fibrobacter sp.]|nr:fibro-slime domain-containing protein [Fibrobacter sp.]
MVYIYSVYYMGSFKEMVGIMTQNKWIYFLSCFLLGSAFVNAQVQVPPAELDVIIRDFEVTHPDFENFTEEQGNILAGVMPATVLDYINNPIWMAKAKRPVTEKCANQATPAAGIPMGVNGYPMATSPNAFLPPYLQFHAAAGAAVQYGEFSSCHTDAFFNPKGLSKLRGYLHELCPGAVEDGNSCNGGSICGKRDWAQTVYITPGMVQQNLYIPMENGALNFYAAKPVKARTACDNDAFDQWYTSVPDYNLETKTTLSLPSIGNNYYQIDYNWNNGGYFPLDVVNPTTGVWESMNTPPGSSQFGPQSLSIFCPPYNYKWAANQVDMNGQSTSNLCAAWLASGGPRSPLAAAVAANSAFVGTNTPGTSKLRNYNFTMMGYGKFKYKAGSTEVFEFAGDDDMWIFVDGVLAVDLGGTHLAAPGKVDIALLAANRHGCQDGQPLAAEAALNGCWTDNSWHHLHFFYADRQTDGSNMRIKTSLSEIAPTIFGQPVILSAEFMPEGNSFVTNLVVNTQLNEFSTNLIANSSVVDATYFPIIVARSTLKIDPLTGVQTVTLDTLAFRVEGFNYVDYKPAAGGYIYELRGSLCTEPTCTEKVNPQNGDLLSFNFSTEATSEARNRFSYTNTGFTITSTTDKTVGSYYWGFGKLIMSVETEIIPTDSTIDRPKFDNDKLLNDIPLVNNQLPMNATGEIIVSALPEEYAQNSDIKKWLEDHPEYTSAPSGNGGTSGALVNGGVDPTGRFAFVQSYNNSAGTDGPADTRCYVDGNGTESCASITFLTGQPFRINVRVFDHLGHFVSQYNETITKEAMDVILNKPSAPAGQSQCTDNITHTMYPAAASGLAVINVKMYPVSQSGRKIATGPYIYQVALIEQPNKHCVNFGGTQNFVDEAYKRTHFTMKRGYRRINQ